MACYLCSIMLHNNGHTKHATAASQKENLFFFLFFFTTRHYPTNSQKPGRLEDANHSDNPFLSILIDLHFSSFWHLSLFYYTFIILHIWFYFWLFLSTIHKHTKWAGLNTNLVKKRTREIYEDKEHKKNCFRDLAAFN